MESDKCFEASYVKKSIKDTHDLSLPWNRALQPLRQMREAKAKSRAPPRAHVHHGLWGSGSIRRQRRAAAVRTPPPAAAAMPPPRQSLA